MRIEAAIVQAADKAEVKARWTPEEKNGSIKAELNDQMMVSAYNTSVKV